MCAHTEPACIVFSCMCGVCLWGGVFMCVVCVSVQVVHVCAVCMGGGDGNRRTDGEFLWMINGLWKEAPCPSDAAGRF